MTLTKAELADLLFDQVGLNKREAKDMVWGTGQSDIPAVLNLYAEQGFLGPLDAEWEKDWETSLPDVTKCMEFVKNFKPTTTK